MESYDLIMTQLYPSTGWLSCLCLSPWLHFLHQANRWGQEGGHLLGLTQYFLFSPKDYLELYFKDIRLFGFFVSSWVSLIHVFQKICVYHLSCWLWREVVHYMPLSILLISRVMPLLSFLILVFCVFHIFFLISLVRTIYLFIFLRKKLLVSLICFSVFSGYIIFPF